MGTVLRNDQRAPRAYKLVVASVLVALAAGAMPAVEPRAQAGAPNIAVTPQNPPTDAYQEPSLAADPSRPGHLAIAYQEASKNYPTCWVAMSGDDGQTWNDVALAGVDAMFPISPNPGDYTGSPWTTECRYPVVAFGPDGTLYYTYQHGFGSAPTIDVVVSLDGGGTWALRHPDAPYTSRPLIGGSWTPAMTVDPRSGRVYIAWERNDVLYNYHPARVEVVSSTDHGATFTSPVVVTPPVQEGPLTPALAIGGDGSLYVSWLDATQWYATGYNAAISVPWQLYVSASRDHGASFTAPALVDPNVGSVCCDPRFEGDGYNRTAPSLAAGSNPGQVYVAYWYSNSNTPHHFHAWFAASADGGNTWGQPKIVGVIPGHDSDHQHRPALASADGLLSLVYYDTDQDGRQDTYMVSSDDGGATFGAPRKLSDVSSDVNVAPSGWSGKTMGNFIDVAISGSELHAAWTDMRRGNQTSDHQDVYTTAVAQSAATEPSAPRLPNTGSVTT